MKDFDVIWRIQDEIRTVVNAVLGECIWNLSYDERRRTIVLELTLSLDEDTVSDLCCQFPITADYDGCGPKGTRFTFYIYAGPVYCICYFFSSIHELFSCYEKRLHLPVIPLHPKADGSMAERLKAAHC